MPRRIDLDAVQKPPRRGGNGLDCGWLVVGAWFVIVLLSLGSYGGFGDFLTPMSAEFGWDPAAVPMPAAEVPAWPPWNAS